MDNPLVSIIIPTKNSSATLGACLESVKNQTYQNVKIIVVDNNSTDNTKEIAKRYTDKVFDFWPERSAQRNFGIANSIGDYVMIVDSDMELNENVVDSCVKKIYSDKNIVGIIIPEESFGEGFWAQCRRLEKSFYVGVDWMEAARFFNKDIFQKVGGYNENMVSGEDWDFSQRVEKFGKIDRINDFIYHNEGKLALSKILKKKFYYAEKFLEYKENSLNREKISKQTGIITRYKLFLSQPKKLLKNPIFGLGMLFMKTCEFGLGGVRYLIKKHKKKGELRHFINKTIAKILPTKQRLQLIYLLVFKRWPRMSNPRTFSEKILNYKLNYKPIFSLCTDKILVKKYVGDKIGNEFIIPTLYSGKTLPVTRDWAIPFVIKANHGSGWNLFIRKPTDLDWGKIETEISKWLQCKYGVTLGELHYDDIDPQILIEPFVSSNEFLPIDYKVYVFHGKPAYVQVVLDRDTIRQQVFFDTQWNKMDFTLDGFSIYNKEFKKPLLFDLMLDKSAILGKDFDFIRVDFYEVNGRLYFGEMTFTPFGGMEKFYPNRMDLELGTLW